MDVIRDTIREALECLADVDYQRRVWAAHDPRGEMDSFEETVARLFDDSGLDIVLERGQVVFGHDVDARLTALGDLVQQVDAYRSPDQVIDDPAMERVRVAAAAILDQLGVQFRNAGNAVHAAAIAADVYAAVGERHRLNDSDPMATLVPPPFIAQTDDLTILRNQTDTYNLEPWFPQEERYTAFDSEGRRFELAVETMEVRRRLLPGTRTLQTVVCRPLEAVPTGAGELAEILRQQLEQDGDSGSLDDLVAMVVKQNGYSWAERRGHPPGGSTSHSG
jgi:hypothetical protein